MFDRQQFCGQTQPKLMPCFLNIFWDKIYPDLTSQKGLHAFGRYKSLFSVSLASNNILDLLSSKIKLIPITSLSAFGGYNATDSTV